MDGLNYSVLHIPACKNFFLVFFYVGKCGLAAQKSFEFTQQLSQKKSKQKGLRIYFSGKNPGFFRFVTLSLEIPEKASFHQWKFSKIVCFFLNTLGNFISFLIDPLEFRHALSSIPLEISCPQLSLFIFFLLQPSNRKKKTFFHKIMPRIPLFAQLQLV